MYRTIPIFDNNVNNNNINCIKICRIEGVLSRKTPLDVFSKSFRRPMVIISVKTGGIVRVSPTVVTIVTVGVL